MRRICDLTLDEFKQLSPAHCSQNSAAGLPESSVNGSSISEQALSDGVAATDRLDSHAGASTSAAAVPCPALGRVFNDEQGKRASCAMHWAVSEDDELPTLAEVFKVGSLPPDLPRPNISRHSAGLLCPSTAGIIREVIMETHQPYSSDKVAARFNSPSVAQ